MASRPPKLLQELEAIAVDRLRINDKAASVAPIGVAKDRDPKLSANLSLDAHRQARRPGEGAGPVWGGGGGTRGVG